MCDYTQREYRCTHFRWIASRWCHEYTETHRRCNPNITFFEYRRDEVCGDCVPPVIPPWEYMINRKMNARPFSGRA